MLLFILFDSHITFAGVGCTLCHKSHYAEIGRCKDCHHGDDRTTRKDLAHQGLLNKNIAWHGVKGSETLEGGVKLLQVLGCRRCHAIAGRGNKFAVNLDRSAVRRTPLELKNSIRSPVSFMPSFQIPEEELDLILAAIYAGSLESEQQKSKTNRNEPQVVHFVKNKRNIKSAFERYCGGCHKVLTKNRGGLGDGDVGFNLSALLTEWYPTLATRNKPWDSEILSRWIMNPRSIRPLTTMPPLRVPPWELEEIMETLR